MRRRFVCELAVQVYLKKKRKINGSLVMHAVAIWARFLLCLLRIKRSIAFLLPCPEQGARDGGR